MDQLTRRLGAVLLAGAVAGGAAGAVDGGAPGGRLGAHANGVKLSFGIPLDAGRDLTLTEMAVSYRNGKGIVIESVEPLGLSGPSRYLGTALLLPPHQGFEMRVTEGFPRISLRASWARLPYTTTTRRGELNLGVGFAVRGPGVTRFAGLAVRYRQDGRRFVAIVPLGASICVPRHRWAGRCSGPTTDEIPGENVRPA
jgi:hypothetical protein